MNFIYISFHSGVLSVMRISRYPAACNMKQSQKCGSDWKSDQMKSDQKSKKYMLLSLKSLAA